MLSGSLLLLDHSHFTHFPDALCTSPPSSSGIVGFSPRFVPPTCTVEPGNWAVTFSLTPESVAGVLASGIGAIAAEYAAAAAVGGAGYA
jgi:hypothetical protein